MALIKNILRIACVLIVLAYALAWIANVTILRAPRELTVNKFFASHNTPYKTYQVFNTHGGALNIYESGDPNKPTLVFIHGSPGNWSDYKEFMVDPRLTKNYRIITLDRPGFGNSTQFNKTLDSEAVALLHVLSDMNIQSMVLVGHSYGGGIVARMASLQPSKIQKLVLISGMYNPAVEQPENWRKIFQQPILQNTIPLPLRNSNNELVAAKTELPELEKDYKNITSPVVIMHGTSEKLVPISDESYIQSVFKNSTHIQNIPLKDKGHMIIWTDKDIIIEAILKDLI